MPHMPPDAALYRSREQTWPWPLIAFVVGVGAAAIGISMLERTNDALVVGLAFLLSPAWSIATRRRVDIDAEGLRVGRMRFTWDDVDDVHFREVPLARAGMFIRLTEAARKRLGLPSPRHRDFGFGLEPAPTPELAAARYDLFLRAHRARLETWFALVNIHLMRRSREQVLDVARAVLPREVVASVVIADPASLTIELRATSIDALLRDAAAVIQDVLPEDVRWNPSFAGGVMVLVGPMTLGEDARATEALERVKAVVGAAITGKPRAIAAMFASRAA